jgi:UDP-N-acetylmuramoyl-tripeptide--D-alanyl-D-alanine ligase
MGHFVGDLREGYRALVQRALEVADELVFAGPDAWAAIGADAGAHPRVHIFETVREASTYLDGVLAAGDLVLVKGRAYAGDHIGRVALTRTHEVRCWRSSCGRWKFCDECALLTIPAEP